MSNNTDTLMELLSNNTTHFSRHQTMLNNQTKSFSSTLPWKMRIQRQTTSKLLWQGTKSEKWQKVQLESFFCLRFKSIIFYIYREFSSLTWKKSSHSKSQFDLSSYYINLKNGSPAPHPHPHPLYKWRCYHMQIFIRASLNNIFFFSLPYINLFKLVHLQLFNIKLSFNCLTSNFCFAKIMSFAYRREWLFMDLRTRILSLGF